MSSILTIVRQRRHRRQQIRSSAQQRSQRAVLGLGFIASAVMVVLVLAVTLTYASITQGLPPLGQVSALLDPLNGALLQPTRFYDRTGRHLVASLSPNDSQRTFIPFSQFPQSLLDATVVVTQPDFWSSPGYVVKGWQDPQTHPTLAQNLVYDLVLWDQPASTLRSLHERLLAAQLTAHYGSQQVLEWYLNSADYGHHAYGAEAAAQLYFGKSATAARPERIGPAGGSEPGAGIQPLRRTFGCRSAPRANPDGHAETGMADRRAGFHGISSRRPFWREKSRVSR